MKRLINSGIGCLLDEKKLVSVMPDKVSDILFISGCIILGASYFYAWYIRFFKE
jgi:hypothetical protein